MNRDAVSRKSGPFVDEANELSTAQGFVKEIDESRKGSFDYKKKGS